MVDPNPPATDAPVRYEIDGAVARLTIDRAASLNALNEDVRRGLADALGDLEERPDVRVLVFGGDGRAFSAGADLRTTAYADLDVDWATRRHRTGAWQRVLDQFDRIPQATVGRLQGHVIGGGALLAAACDIRVAADDTVLRIPELAIGIPLTWAGIPILVREVGLPMTRDWVMTGRAVGADELHRTGFAQRLAPRSELDDAVDQCVAELVAMPAAPLAMTRAMTAALGRGHPAMVAAWGDPDHMQASLQDPEQRDAARAYVNRNL